MVDGLQEMSILREGPRHCYRGGVQEALGN